MPSSDERRNGSGRTLRVANSWATEMDFYTEDILPKVVNDRFHSVIARQPVNPVYGEETRYSSRHTAALENGALYLGAIAGY